MGFADKLKEQAKKASDGFQDVMAYEPTTFPPIEALPAHSTATVWEYATDLIQAATLVRKRDNVAPLHDHLAKRGAAGWELVQATLHVDLQDAREGHILIFKRPAL